MNCKKGDLAKIVNPALMELRGKIVRCMEPIYSFREGSVEPAWIIDRELSYVCPRCGYTHSTTTMLDIELRPLPGLPPEDVKENERELTTA
jgi:hypothetical protein